MFTSKMWVRLAPIVVSFRTDFSKLWLADPNVLKPNLKKDPNCSIWTNLTNILELNRTSMSSRRHVPYKPRLK